MHAAHAACLRCAQVEEDEEMFAGEHVELLALFANPTLPAQLAAQLGLRPLKLGQELRFLLRTIPKVSAKRGRTAARAGGARA
jgi:hypothetical protein